MRRPGSIQFDPGMMSSECALLIAAFMHDLELDPGRWFKFIGIDFQKSADEALSAEGVNHAAPQSPDGPAAETLSEAQTNAASAAHAQEPLFAAGEALTGTFRGQSHASAALAGSGRTDALAHDCFRTAVLWALCCSG